MNGPVDIKPIAVGGSLSDGDMLDHRNQPQSLPRSARSDSVSHQSIPAITLSGSHDSGALRISFSLDRARERALSSSSDRKESVTRFSSSSNEFAIEDDLQFGDLEDSLDLGGQSNRARNASRPRTGSHLDTVLSQAVRISPIVTYDSRGRPPSLDLDKTKGRTRDRSASSSRSAAAACRQPMFSPRVRRLSQHVKPLEKDEDRNSLDAPSHPDSQDGEEEEAEQDVCFPMSEEVRSAEGVDFDELDAFVRDESLAQTALHRTRSRKTSYLGSKSDVQLDEKETNPSSRSSDEDRVERDTTSTYAAGMDYSSRFASPAIVPMKTRHIAVPELKADGRTGPGPLLSKAISQPRPLTTSYLRQMERNQDAPDRFSFFTSERDDTIHAPTIGGLLPGPTGSFRKLFKQGRGCWWLDVMCPSDAEMRTIAKAFGIHPLTAEDIRVQETREKVELFKSYYFVCFRSFDHDKDSEDFLEPVNIYVVVFKEGLISFHFAPTSHPANVRRRIRQLRDYVSVSADWISYAIIDDVTDVFMPLIHEIENETDAIEDAVLITRETDTGDMLRRIGECRKKVMALFRLLHGKADVIKMFAKRCNEQWDVAPKGEIGLYLGDIQDHLVTMTSSLTQFEKILSRSHSNYLAQLSIHSMESSNRLNSVLGKITLIATMLVPLNLITGLFGMNVAVPGKNSESLAWFFGIVAFICVFCTLGVYFAKKSKMLV